MSKSRRSSASRSRAASAHPAETGPFRDIWESALPRVHTQKRPVAPSGALHGPSAHGRRSGAGPRPLKRNAFQRHDKRAGELLKPDYDWTGMNQASISSSADSNEVSSDGLRDAMRGGSNRILASHSAADAGLDPRPAPARRAARAELRPGSEALDSGSRKLPRGRRSRTHRFLRFPRRRQPSGPPRVPNRSAERRERRGRIVPGSFPKAAVA